MRPGKSDGAGGVEARAVGWRRRSRGKGSRMAPVESRQGQSDGAGGVEERQSMEPEELRPEQEMASPLQLRAVNTFSLEWHQSLGK